MTNKPKWPEKKKHDRNCYGESHIRDCNCDGWNACHDAFMKVINEQESENNMTELKPYEYFCDESYYHLWCVRRIGDNEFGQGFHLHNEREAKELCDLLNTRSPQESGTDKGPNSPLSELVKDKLCAMQFHGCPAWFKYVKPLDGTDNETPSLEQMLTDLSNTILRCIEGSGYYITKKTPARPTVRVEDIIYVIREYFTIRGDMPLDTLMIIEYDDIVKLSQFIHTKFFGDKQ